MYLLEGQYESVYNARWSHVVEVTGGEGTGMEAYEGEPPQPWTYKAVGNTLEKDDGVQQSGAPRLRLMVLTSDKAWPYSWGACEFNRDCYVNCEVERVWQIVKGVVDKWSSGHGETDFTPDPCVLIGTPGIGKSMAAGSYLLYQLLHYDAEKLPVVVYYIADQTFLFDKTTKKLSEYLGKGSTLDVVDRLSWRGVKGYIIYDVAEEVYRPSVGLPCNGWGMIVVTSPNENKYELWANQNLPLQIVMNCPDESDVKAMCVWEQRSKPPQQQAEYWREVKGRMDKVGPILRYIFDEQAYDDRIEKCHETVEETISPETQYYTGLGNFTMWCGNSVFHWLAKVVRIREEVCKGEFSLNLPISAHLCNKTLCMLAKLMQQDDFNSLILRLKHNLVSENMERCTVFAFLDADFITAIRHKVRELKRTTRRQPHRSALEVYSQERPTRHHVLPPPHYFSEKVGVDCCVLYVPGVEDFPLVDAFFFVNSNPRTLVGLRMSTASEHHTTASTVRQFTECLAAYFNGWEELSQELSWEIIYVQQADGTPMNDWQRCDVVNTDGVSEEEDQRIAAFWKGRVLQYQLAISPGDFRRDEALRSEV
ncbi:retrotransposon hot spot (RHS) protein, putative [Trypanosoma cruzi]|uniref:Retrotransposon hot spot (RHS) protein, putative n=2 Tax=Trypanosoma cruzi TaxID=5693 RepID=Q4D621_TRYCC|nr:retrotransposon hot spot (RHS) protein, putative [Trypanosoma cruzi]XP_809829.1 retrotransposon hot spot (RHS) protein, putative [Trypanosoma cruzi]EAN87975.1 retrotransposon hot spot (RHS) protein, putative [Trypanosoma cruzi]EAN87978.1 retrotransposon hot spot (RHS) protein, putative [Trypanosoma cruzi]|eukprot:XP_809826.1 retrotransposon hot spot (RHS) protein [Trypanosoma cruzi strain CL Brener]